MRLSRVSICLFCLCSCIEPYNPPFLFHKLLVIQGMITDQPGPYIVQIANTIPIVAQIDSTSLVSDAKVVITDNEGIHETLTEKSPGFYYTDSIQGIIGRSYSMTITTKEGWVYQSTAETLLPVGDFDMHSEFQMNEPAMVRSEIKSTNGFNVYIDSEVLPEQESRVWWRWTGTFEYLTFPQLIKTECCNGQGKSDTPPKCSGYVSTDANLCDPQRPTDICYGNISYVFPCTCCTCWANEYNQQPLISDKRFVANGKIPHQFIGFVEVNVRTFYNKYYFAMEQLSVSEAVYTFWKNVINQESNSSNLFQTPPPKTTGNFSALSKNSIPVIGYFAASAIKSRAITFSQSDVPYYIFPIDTVISNCLSGYVGLPGTTTKPSFW